MQGSILPSGFVNGESCKMATNATATNLPSFDCPTWAGKPPPGLHLDVMKGDKMVEKLIIDEKKYYLFGRNPDMCDFTIDHQSCSRVHAALVYHKHLKRVFLIDNNSTHGTFLGHIRLEPNKPQQVPIDSTMSFGASTRAYTIREKPQSQQGTNSATGDSKAGDDEEGSKGLLGLPEEETELENLTEFNTAHNKRISTLTIEEGNLDIQRPKRKRRNSRVTFNEDDEVINPEDIDPSVGRFRNMVQTAVVPIKKQKMERHGSLSMDDVVTRRIHNYTFGGGLYGDLPPTSHEGHPTGPPSGATILGGLPLPFPNPAPEVNLAPDAPQPPVTLNPVPVTGPYPSEVLNEPRKKKYAKEAWPGKKPTPSLLI
ncbi:nuclear inhibitor of protein phosphatase 1-like [Oncorhynchus kisutch]|nr:nuclear inhibitor of protein phosphatase 1-like [Oncorhynchus kisutch]